MGRRFRQDRPGAWHHVFARGLARRTVFESDRDIRVFKCLLALEVRRGTLEVHAFVFLTTHTHLLVRSPVGELARALKRVFHGYVRWFNRSRRRDGSLFRGRFGSRSVTSDIDRLNVFAYVDDNVVRARRAATPEAYAHGSARYWRSGRPPPWLSSWYLCELLGVAWSDSDARWDRYCRALGPRRGPAQARLIEARIERRCADADPLDDLVAATPERVHAWMLAKAALADQTRPGLPVLDPDSVETSWRKLRGLVRGEQRGRRGPSRPLGTLAHVALLRDLSGLHYDAIARRLRTSGTEARTRYRLHAERLASDRAYAAAIAEITREAIASVHVAER